MSVVGAIINKHETESRKMENNELKRYTFGGFTFGTSKLFNLTINIQNHAGYGTMNLVEMGIELTTEERLELIKLLINAGESDN